MRHCSWRNPDAHQVLQLTIQRLGELRKGKAFPKIIVTREEFEAWLGDPAKQPRDRLRAYLMMLLGRMEPDRDFKRGIKAR